MSLRIFLARIATYVVLLLTVICSAHAGDRIKSSIEKIDDRVRRIRATYPIRLADLFETIGERAEERIPFLRNLDLSTYLQNCHHYGTSLDQRSKVKQYSCGEIPYGRMVGLHPVDGEAEKNKLRKVMMDEFAQINSGKFNGQVIQSFYFASGPVSDENTGTSISHPDSNLIAVLCTVSEDTDPASCRADNQCSAVGDEYDDCLQAKRRYENGRAEFIKVRDRHYQRKIAEVEERVQKWRDWKSVYVYHSDKKKFSVGPVKLSIPDFKFDIQLNRNQTNANYLYRTYAEGKLSSKDLGSDFPGDFRVNLIPRGNEFDARFCSHFPGLTVRVEPRKVSAEVDLFGLLSQKAEGILHIANLSFSSAHVCGQVRLKYDELVGGLQVTSSVVNPVILRDIKFEGVQLDLTDRDPLLEIADIFIGLQDLVGGGFLNLFGVKGNSIEDIANSELNTEAQELIRNELQSGKWVERQLRKLVDKELIAVQSKWLRRGTIEALSRVINTFPGVHEIRDDLDNACSYLGVDRSKCHMIVKEIKGIQFTPFAKDIESTQELCYKFKLVLSNWAPGNFGWEPVCSLRSELTADVIDDYANEAACMIRKVMADRDADLASCFDGSDRGEVFVQELFRKVATTAANTSELSELLRPSTLSSLEAFWRFEESESATNILRDTMSSGFDAIRYGGARIVQNAAGKLVANLDGKRDYIGLDHKIAGSLQSSFSIHTRIQMKDAGKNIGRNQYLFSKGDGSFNDHSRNLMSLVIVNSGDSDYLALKIHDGFRSFGTRKVNELLLSRFSPDEWIDVTGVYDGDVLRIYINGKHIAAADRAAKVSLSRINDASATIGRLGDGTRNFHGLIENFGIWTRAITPNEIVELVESL